MPPIDRCQVNSLSADAHASPVAGTVRWDPANSLWNGGMMVASFTLAPLYVSWSALVVFVVSTGAILLLGHSVGFHRRLIHHSFDYPLWLEQILVWVGTCVGMSGPLWMIRTHDLRDWAQRQPDCHDYLAHRQGMLKDAWWQLHCKLELDHPPSFDFGRIGQNRFYLLLEGTWMLQQVPIAGLLVWAGGMPWMIWGVCVRVCASVTGHWFVGHLAHRHGPQSWLVKEAGVQAHDVPWAAIPTMGEAWHNNNHAFPASARIGLYQGQSDWGYAFILLLKKVGLAWNIALPEDLGREDTISRTRGSDTTRSVVDQQVILLLCACGPNGPFDSFTINTGR